MRYGLCNSWSSVLDFAALQGLHCHHSLTKEAPLEWSWPPLLRLLPSSVRSSIWSCSPAHPGALTIQHMPATQPGGSLCSRRLSQLPVPSSKHCEYQSVASAMSPAGVEVPWQFKYPTCRNTKQAPSFQQNFIPCCLLSALFYMRLEVAHQLSCARPVRVCPRL